MADRAASQHACRQSGGEHPVPARDVSPRPSFALVGGSGLPWRSDRARSVGPTSLCLLMVMHLVSFAV